MENQYKQIRDYFEGLAKAYKPIGHTTAIPRFFENTIDSINNPAPGPLMYLSPLEFGFAEQDGSQIVVPTVRLSILDHFMPGDYESMHTALRDTFAHIKEIQAKMIADRRNPAHASQCLLMGWDIEDARLFTQDPILDSWIGQTITFSMRIDESFTITPDQWQ